MSEPSVNSKVRLLGGIGTAEKPSPSLGSRVSGQAAAPPVSITTPPVASNVEPVFLGDSADGRDVLGSAELVQPLAQLCVAPQVQTPFLAAIAGPSGSGKSFALKRLAEAVERLSASAAASPGAALPRVVIAEVDAGSGVEAPIAIASAAYAALDRDPGGVDYSALLEESGHAGGDPQRAARAATDRHDDLVRKLEAERSHRDEVEAKRARLADSLLFETPGSRIDVFARARRGTIEARLRRFGLAGTDADASFRNLARDMSTLGAGARVGIFVRAIWAYGSQARLIVWAIIAFALAFGLGFLHGTSGLAAIGRLGDSFQPVAEWIGAHSQWFERAAQVLFVLGALAIALNLWRALSFSSLLLRGAGILNHEARDRRRDLDQRATQLNQRVAALTADAEAAAKRAEAASERAGGKTAVRAPGPEFLETSHAPSTAARAFLAALGQRIGQANATTPAPDRLIFAIDNLDQLPPAAAIAWIDAAQSAIGPGSAGLIAFDPWRLSAGFDGRPQAERRFGKWLQASLSLPARDGVDGERLVARLLSDSALPASASEAKDKDTRALVEPLSKAESSLLAALAPLAADSPREAKRFINAYRLARCSTAPRPVVALMQAVAFADDEAQTAMRGRLADGSGELGEIAGPRKLVEAVKAARAANNGPISIEDARAAAEIARRYALPV